MNSLVSSSLMQNLPGTISVSGILKVWGCGVFSLMQNDAGEGSRVALPYLHSGQLSNIHFYKCQHFLGSTAVQTECEVSVGFKSTKHGTAPQENSCEAVQKLIRKSQIALCGRKSWWDCSIAQGSVLTMWRSLYLQSHDLIFNLASKKLGRGAVL